MTKQKETIHHFSLFYTLLKMYGTFAFKNPQNDSAGRLIEACGLKGFRIGGAMISTKHANFFINTGNATAHDMIRLMEMVRKTVEEYNGVLLEPEVNFL